MAKDRIVKFDMRADTEFLRQVDELRRDEADLPSRAQMVRRVVGAMFEQMEQRKKRTPRLSRSGGLGTVRPG